MIFDFRFTIYELLWQTRAPWDSRLQRRLAQRGKRGALATAALVALSSHSPDALAFEGRISATLTRGGETQTLLYTAATNQLRIERRETDHPYARDIVDRETGAVTLVFPHNRSFVRLKTWAGPPLPLRRCRACLCPRAGCRRVSARSHFADLMDRLPRCRCRRTSSFPRGMFLQVSDPCKPGLLNPQGLGLCRRASVPPTYPECQLDRLSPKCPRCRRCPPELVPSQAPAPPGCRADP
jgi:hypothetical protein